MKRLTLSIVVCALLMSGCQPSKTYIGTWIGMDESGETVDVTITSDGLMTIREGDDELSISFRQTQYGSLDDVGYYRWSTEYGPLYVVFPDRSDRSTAQLIAPTQPVREFKHVKGDVLLELVRP